METFVTTSDKRIQAKDIFIWIITLLSIKFYTLFTTYSIGKGLVLFSIIIIIALLLLFLAYDHSKGFKKNFTSEIFLLLFALIISAFAATVFYDQKFFKTLFLQFEFYFLFFYFLLHKLKPNPKVITDMFIVIGIIHCIIYFVQTLVYPIELVSASLMVDRGTLRIFMPSLGFTISGYLVALSRYYITRKVKYIIVVIPMLVVFFLLGTRQVLAVIFLLTLLSILLSKRVKSKFWMVFLIALCTIPLFIIFQDIFNNMLLITKQQHIDIQQNIRMQASKYFLLKFNSNRIWFLIGNGYPDHYSAYGRSVAHLTEANGFYLSDIGIIGDFFRFGIFFVIGILAIHIKLIRGPVTEEYSYIRYNSIGEIITMLTGAGLGAQSIGLLCYNMYIVDLIKNDRAKMKNDEKNKQLDSQDKPPSSLS